MNDTIASYHHSESLASTPRSHSRLSPRPQRQSTTPRATFLGGEATADRGVGGASHSSIVNEAAVVSSSIIAFVSLSTNQRKSAVNSSMNFNSNGGGGGGALLSPRGNSSVIVGDPNRLPPSITSLRAGDEAANTNNNMSSAAKSSVVAVNYHHSFSASINIKSPRGDHHQHYSSSARPLPPPAITNNAAVASALLHVHGASTAIVDSGGENNKVNAVVSGGVDGLAFPPTSAARVSPSTPLVRSRSVRTPRLQACPSFTFNSVVAVDQRDEKANRIDEGNLILDDTEMKEKGRKNAYNDTDYDVAETNSSEKLCKPERRRTETTVNANANAGDGGLAAGKKKAPAKFTVSLVFIFASQCVLIAASFITIITFSSEQINATATHLINKGITASLQYASTEVVTPFISLEQLIDEYRSRYHAAGLISHQSFYPCDDRLPEAYYSSLARSTANNSGVAAPPPLRLTLQPSAPFYADTYLAIATIPRLLSVSVFSVIGDNYNATATYTGAVSEEFTSAVAKIDWRNISDYDQIKNLISQCSISKESMYRRYKNYSITSTRPPGRSEFGDLDSVPLHNETNNESATSWYNSVHEGDHLIEALSATGITASPWYTPQTGRYLLYVSPVVYSYRNSTSGIDVVRFQADVRLASLLHLPEFANYSILVAVTFAYSIEELYDTLMAITPSHHSAHTSLYDLTNKLLISSTRIPQHAQFNPLTNQFYAQGDTSNHRVDNAFKHSRADTQSPGTMSIEYIVDRASGNKAGFGRKSNTVISSLVFEITRSKSVYAVVQSAPASYYFEEVDHLLVVVVALGVTCCVVVVLVCAALAFAIRTNIAKIIANMALAARLKNHRVTPMSTSLSEIDRLVRGFVFMNTMLSEAKAYLPQHMLLTSSSGEDHSCDDSEDHGSGKDNDDDGMSDHFTAGRSKGSRAKRSGGVRAKGRRSGTLDDDDEGSINTGHDYHERGTNGTGSTYTPTATNTATMSRGGGRRVLNTRKSGGSSNNNDNNNNTNDGGKLPMRMRGAAAVSKQQGAAKSSGGIPVAGPSQIGAFGLNAKRVTILHINVRHFHRTVANPATSFNIPSATSRLTELVSGIASSHRGVVDSFHGDHFVLSFNAVRPNPEGPAKSSKCAMEVIELAGAGGYEGKEPFLFSIGISSGRAFVGHLGSSTLKRLSIIGAVYSKAAALEKLCRRFNGYPRAFPLGEGNAARAASSLAPKSIMSDNSSNTPSTAVGSDKRAPQPPKRAFGGPLQNENTYYTTAVPAVQCLVDRSISSEVEYQCTLQLMGAVYGAPYCDVPHFIRHTINERHGRPRASIANEDKAPVNSEADPNARQQGHFHQLSLFYALRSYSNNSEKRSDEWLYEILGDDRGKHLVEINALVGNYLESVANANNRSTVRSIALRNHLSMGLRTLRDLLMSNVDDDDDEKQQALDASRVSSILPPSSYNMDKAAVSEWHPVHKLANEALRYAFLLAEDEAEAHETSLLNGGSRRLTLNAKMDRTKERMHENGSKHAEKASVSVLEGRENLSTITNLMTGIEEVTELFALEPQGCPRGLFYTGSS